MKHPTHTCKHIAKAAQAHAKTKALSKSLQVSNPRKIETVYGSRTPLKVNCEVSN